MLVEPSYFLHFPLGNELRASSMFKNFLPELEQTLYELSIDDCWTQRLMMPTTCFPSFFWQVLNGRSYF